MKKEYKFLAVLLIIFYLVNFDSSCTTPNKIVYFQNLQRDTTIHTFVDKEFEIKIRINDLLYIGVSSLDPTNSIIFNAPQASPINSSISQSNSIGGSTSGYLVDKDGNIQFPKIGMVHVEGMTRNDLRNKLIASLLSYLKDPVVTVRFLNLQVTVIGEVNRPQVIALSGESITLLQALGECGDIAFTGRRDNILVIRENGTDKEFKRLNLNDNTIFSSPFYYLKPDDVVYVEPSKSKSKNIPQKQQLISYILTGVTIAVTILSRFIK